MWLLGLTPQPPRGPGPPKLGKSMIGIAFGSAPWTVFLLPFFRSKIHAVFEAAFFPIFQDFGTKTTPKSLKNHPKMVLKTASLPDMFFSPVLVCFLFFLMFFCTCCFFENALVHWYLRGILRVGTFMRTQALILLALFFDYVFGTSFCSVV